MPSVYQQAWTILKQRVQIEETAWSRSDLLALMGEALEAAVTEAEGPPEDVPLPPMTPAAQANAEALTNWRLLKARTSGKPAFVFLTNEHLGDIARRDPCTLDQLGRCAGIGPVRLDTYGEELLAVLAWARSHDPDQEADAPPIMGPDVSPDVSPDPLSPKDIQVPETPMEKLARIKAKRAADNARHPSDLPF